MVQARRAFLDSLKAQGIKRGTPEYKTARRNFQTQYKAGATSSRELLGGVRPSSAGGGAGAGGGGSSPPSGAGTQGWIPQPATEGQWQGGQPSPGYGEIIPGSVMGTPFDIEARTGRPVGWNPETGGAGIPPLPANPAAEAHNPNAQWRWKIGPMGEWIPSGWSPGMEQSASQAAPGQAAGSPGDLHATAAPPPGPGVLKKK